MLSENSNTVKTDWVYGFSTQAFKMIDCFVMKQQFLLFLGFFKSIRCLLEGEREGEERERERMLIDFLGFMVFKIMSLLR